MGKLFLKTAKHPETGIAKGCWWVDIHCPLGTHKLLVHDFVRAVVENKLPPVHAWAAARYMLPGILAHQSAMQNNAALDVPDFGDPPADWDMME